MVDFIIVGAGSAGCVLAHRLSADPARRVLLLEAGRDERRREISIPAAWSSLLRADCDWGYETEPNPGLDGRRLYVPRGRMLGGTSSLNAMIHLRGNRADFDAWAAAGNTGWSYDDVLPYFRRSERNLRGASTYHGGDGPLTVSDVRRPNPLATAFIAAAESAGIPRTDDFNGSTQDGAGPIQLTIRNGRRCSAADAFLRPILGRLNLTVESGALATRILFDGRRAVGVAYQQNGEMRQVFAEREVILAAGALDSPRLLLLSGVGPADEIRRHGIDVVHDLPGVGRNLQEHATAGILVRCTRPVSLLSVESRMNLLRYVLFRGGPLASNGVEAAAFVRTRPDLDAPDVEILMVPVLWLDEGATRPTEHGYTIAVVLLTPRSRGSVTLRSNDRRDPPRIDTNLFSDAAGEDMKTVIEGIRIARRINATQPLASFNAGEIEPGSAATDDAAIAASVRRLGQTLWHPVGTCRMGEDADAVVDPALRVRGLEGLRVVDASVLPDNIRGHTNAAAIMIAEKAADLMVGQDGQG